MKSSITLFAAAALGSALASPSDPYDDWQPPASDAVRGPCPMLNTLANHGFLPRSGKDISLNKTQDALVAALNIERGLAGDLFDFAVTTNPAPNATTFDLDHLARHNILEHDASLSRVDAHFGDPAPFNQTIFDQTKRFWTGDTITIQMAGNARAARELTSMVENPEFSFNRLQADFSAGEGAAYVIIIGRSLEGQAPKTWVEYFFENERLPLELGWTRPDVTYERLSLRDALVSVANATGFPPEPPSDTSSTKKRTYFH
ncbi:Cloroperoxidase [Xylariomycetidae sp. FL2044]|nr:Cloroperoxidase [Xylariomycetidae sp. FL2044]